MTIKARVGAREVDFDFIIELPDGYSLRKWHDQANWAIHKPDGNLDFFMGLREMWIADKVAGATFKAGRLKGKEE